MIRRLAFLIAGIFATLMVAAVEPSDSLRVQVGVEITMPDGTRVIRQVNTMIPDPGPDASVATLVNLAAAKLSPDYRPVAVSLETLESFVYFFCEFYTFGNGGVHFPVTRNDIFSHAGYI